MGIFSKKHGSVTQLYEPILRKLRGRWKDGWKDRTDRWNLPAEAGHPKKTNKRKNLNFIIQL